MDDASSENRNDVEMRIPRPSSAVFGIALLWSFIAASVGIAMFNLSRAGATPLLPLFASVIWLLLVAGSVAMAIAVAGGVRQFLINCLGEFSAQQLVWIEWRYDESPAVCFGFQLGPWRWSYVRIRLDAIAQVRWSSGQGTALAGRDMNDWSVVVKFDKRKSAITPPDHRYPD